MKTDLDRMGPRGPEKAASSGIAAAVGAAVQQATGVQIRELPLTPERVWRAIAEQQRRDGS